MSQNKKVGKTPTTIQPKRGVSTPTLQENAKKKQLTPKAKNVQTSYAFNNKCDKDSAGVRYVTEDLIRRLTKKQSLNEITSLNLTLNKEGGKKLKFIENLDNVTNLQILNLSCNQIEKIERLDHLIYLRELNLSFNNISKMDGLENLTQLQTLNLVGNSIEKIPLWIPQKLKVLRVLRLAKNRISSLSEIIKLKFLSDLTNLTLTENPLCQLLHARLYIIFHVRTLSSLDGQLITQKEQSDAERRYSQDELSTLQENFRQITLSHDNLKKENSQCILERDSLQQQLQTLHEKESQFSGLCRDLENQLIAKTELLQNKTAELTLVYEKHYQLEQELAFFKIDSKFDSFSKNISPTEEKPCSKKGILALTNEVQETMHKSLDNELVDKKRTVDRAKERLDKLKKDLEITEDQLVSALKILAQATSSKLLKLTNNEDKICLKNDLQRKSDRVKKLCEEKDALEKEVQAKENKIQTQENELQKLKQNLVNLDHDESDLKSLNKAIEQKEVNLQLSKKLLKIHQQKLDEIFDCLATETQNVKQLEEFLMQGETSKSKKIIFELKQIILKMEDYITASKKHFQEEKHLCDLMEENIKLGADLKQEKENTNILNEQLALSKDEISELRKDYEEELTLKQAEIAHLQQLLQSPTKIKVSDCNSKDESLMSTDNSAINNSTSTTEDSISSPDMNILGKLHQEIISLQQEFPRLNSSIQPLPATNFALSSEVESQSMNCCLEKSDDIKVSLSNEVELCQRQLEELHKDILERNQHLNQEKQNENKDEDTKQMKKPLKNKLAEVKSHTKNVFRTLSEEFLSSTPRSPVVQDLFSASNSYCKGSQVSMTKAPNKSSSYLEQHRHNICQRAEMERMRSDQCNSRSFNRSLEYQTSLQNSQHSEAKQNKKLRCTCYQKKCNSDNSYSKYSTPSETKLQFVELNSVQRKKDLHILDSLLMSNKSELENVQKQIQSLYTKYDQIKTEMKIICEEKEQKEKKMHDIHLQVSSAKKNLSFLKAELKLLQEEKSQQEKYLLDLKQELSSKTEDLNNCDIKIKVALEVLEDLTSAEACAKKDNDQLNCAFSNEALNQINQELADKQKEMELLNKQIISRQMEVQNVTCSNNLLKNNITSLCEEKTQVEKKVNTTKDELFHLREIVKKLENQKSCLEEKCRKLIVELGETRNRLSMLTPERFTTLKEVAIAGQSQIVPYHESMARYCNHLQNNCEQNVLSTICASRTWSAADFISPNDDVFEKENSPLPDQAQDKMSVSFPFKNTENKKSQDIKVLRALKKRLNNLELVLFMFKKSEKPALSGSSSIISLDDNTT